MTKQPSVAGHRDAERTLLGTRVRRPTASASHTRAGDTGQPHTCSGDGLGPQLPHSTFPTHPACT